MAHEFTGQRIARERRRDARRLALALSFGTLLGIGIAVGAIWLLILSGGA